MSAGECVAKMNWAPALMPSTIAAVSASWPQNDSATSGSSRMNSFGELNHSAATLRNNSPWETS